MIDMQLMLIGESFGQRMCLLMTPALTKLKTVFDKNTVSDDDQKVLADVCASALVKQTIGYAEKLQWVTFFLNKGAKANFSRGLELQQEILTMMEAVAKELNLATRWQDRGSTTTLMTWCKPSTHTEDMSMFIETLVSSYTNAFRFL